MFRTMSYRVTELQSYWLTGTMSYRGEWESEMCHMWWSRFISENHFLFPTKTQEPVSLSGWVVWRCVVVSGKTMAVCRHIESHWWVDLHPVISWASETGKCIIQPLLELQINHGLWLPSVSNKDKYAETKNASHILAAKNYPLDLTDYVDVILEPN